MITGVSVGLAAAADGRRSKQGDGLRVPIRSAWNSPCTGSLQLQRVVCQLKGGNPVVAFDFTDTALMQGDTTMIPPCMIG
jgi:hypothetical protein